MKVGDRVRCTEYPDQFVVGVTGTVVDIGFDDGDYIEVELDLSPNPDRPHEFMYLFNDFELEVIND